jgi:cell wall-associated NlpC family hydrolase
MSLIQTLQQAGFRGDALRTAWAVAMAESGGRADAHNPNASTGDNSYGLFQINMLGGLGPARLKQYGLASNEALLDPTTNARVAFRMSGGGRDWSPWSAFKSGAYKKYLTAFPGAGKAGPTKAAQAGAEAFNAGPAGVAFGPSPAQFQAQAVGYFMAQAQAAAAGKPVDMGALTQLVAAKQQMAQAQTSAAAWGGSLDPKKAAPIPADAPNAVKNALSIAHQQIGKPYVWGGESPEEGGFDCSGLMDYAFRKAGIKLPGRLTTWSILKMGQSVKGGQYRPGDAIVTNGGKHVVWYVGNGQVIAAPRRGEVVQYQPLSQHTGGIVDVRRIV